MKTKTETVHHSGGERKYRIKKDSLNSLETKNYGQFEKHLLQEAVKQVLFAQGSEEVEVRDMNDKGEVVNSRYQRIIPKETIKFLLDYELIEECKY